MMLLTFALALASGSAPHPTSPHTTVPTPAWMEPGVARYVAADGRRYLEVRDQEGRYAGDGKRSRRAVGYRLVALGDGSLAPHATTRWAREPAYRELEDGDALLAYGALDDCPEAAAVLPDGAGFAVLTGDGLRRYDDAGAAVLALGTEELFGAEPAARLVRGESAELEPLDRDDLWGAPRRRLALWPDGAQLWAGVRRDGRPWQLVRVGADGRVAAPGDDRLPPGVGAEGSAPGAALTVDLGARRGIELDLAGLLSNDGATLEARLRAAWWLAAAGDRSGAPLVGSVLREREARAQHERYLAAIVAGRALRWEDGSLLVECAFADDERWEALRPPYHESVRELGAPCVPALLALCDAADVSHGERTIAQRHLDAILAGLRPDDPWLAPLARSLAGSPRGRAAFSTLTGRRGDGACPSEATLALTLEWIALAREDPSALAGVPLPESARVVAALVELLESEPARAAALRALRRTADVPLDLADVWTPVDWTAWWARARGRPQRGELLCRAREAGLREGLERCLASEDVAAAPAAADVLLLVGDELVPAGLAPLARRLVDEWEPRTPAEQRARARLAALLDG